MDQIRIGQFIAEQRKALGMTQRALAERLGVSDKTVSKWETGKGMPEISLLPPLCAALGISMNSLLSGQYLSHEDYPEKAEENMKHLIENAENTKRRQWTAVLACAAGAVLLGFVLGLSGLNATFLLDLSSLLVVWLPVALLLLAAGLWRAFWRGLRMAGGRGAIPDRKEIEKARAAVRLMSRAMLGVGGIATLLALIAVLLAGGEGAESLYLRPSFAVALLSALYGLIPYMLLLPVRSRLELMKGE